MLFAESRIENDWKMEISFIRNRIKSKSVMYFTFKWNGEIGEESEREIETEGQRVRVCAVVDSLSKRETTNHAFRSVSVCVLHLTFEWSEREVKWNEVFYCWWWRNGARVGIKCVDLMFPSFPCRLICKHIHNECVSHWAMNRMLQKSHNNCLLHRNFVTNCFCLISENWIKHCRECAVDDSDTPALSFE